MMRSLFIDVFGIIILSAMVVEFLGDLSHFGLFSYLSMSDPTLEDVMTAIEDDLFVDNDPETKASTIDGFEPKYSKFEC